jgi:hypothetical protein
MPQANTTSVVAEINPPMYVGELAPFDLLVLLILSETVQNSLVGDDTSLFFSNEPKQHK